MKLRLHSIFSLLIFVGLTDLLVAESMLLERIPNDSVLVVSLDIGLTFRKKSKMVRLAFFQSPAWSKMSQWMEESLKVNLEQRTGLEEMIDQMKDWKDSFDGGMVLSLGGFENGRDAV